MKPAISLSIFAIRLIELGFLIRKDSSSMENASEEKHSLSILYNICKSAVEAGLISMLCMFLSHIFTNFNKFRFMLKLGM